MAIPNPEHLAIDLAPGLASSVALLAEIQSSYGQLAQTVHALQANNQLKQASVDAREAAQMNKIFDLEIRVETLSQELRLEREQNADHRHTIERLNGEVASLQAEVSRRETEKQNLLAKIAEQDALIQSQASEIRVVNQNFSVERVKVSELEAKVIKCDEEIQSQFNEIVQQKQILEDQVAQIASLSRSLREAQERILHLDGEVANRDATIKNHLATIANQQALLDTNAVQIADLGRNLQDARQLNDQYAAKITGLESTVALLTAQGQQKDATIQSQIERIEGLSLHLESAKATVSQQASEIFEQKQTIAAQQQEIQSLRNHAHDLSTQLGAIAQKHRQELETLNSEIFALKQTIRTQSTEIGVLQQEVQEGQQVCQNQRDFIGRLEREVEAAKPFRTDAEDHRDMMNLARHDKPFVLVDDSDSKRVLAIELVSEVTVDGFKKSVVDKLKLSKKPTVVIAGVESGPMESTFTRRHSDHQVVYLKVQTLQTI
eukprot:m.843603 g.843603  ORF g.843603 m.843603 type:complete len:491 (+) comp59536_c2_seq2:247-1719(+)